jgi:Calcineurin-like phosphoesterase
LFYPSSLWPILLCCFFPLVSSQTFCAIADIPYNSSQTTILREQLLNNVPSDRCGFLIHLGDIRANNGMNCQRAEYESVASILRTNSPVPVFMLLGDNEWNDCLNPDTALGFWDDSFLFFHNQWSHSLSVTYQPGRPYNFAIWLEDAIIFGVRIVGGDVPDDNERQTRLADQIAWIKETVLDYVDDQNNQGRTTGRIVIASHANPNSRHATFYDALEDFVENTLLNSHPILLLNGDAHVWSYRPNYRVQSSLLKVVLEGFGREPPTIITINNSGQPASTETAFTFDRQGSPNQGTPTRQPTVPPAKPTTMPTGKPTVIPTQIPTGSPTTITSTGKPTGTPSSKPTSKPTVIPTRIPTSSPTTFTPAGMPSGTPTKKPTSKPTLAPTRIPTGSPASINPTGKPTFAPTSKPTNTPTRTPTRSPNASTTKPTAAPTGGQGGNACSFLLQQFRDASQNFLSLFVGKTDDPDPIRVPDQ